MRRTRVLFGTAVAIVVALCAWASPNPGPPMSALNAYTGNIETVDAPWSGTNYDIRHVIDANGGASIVVTILTTNPGDDLSPRLTIDPANGDTWVAWWRNSSPAKVLVRRRSNATGSWSSEQTESDPSEASRDPSVAFDGTSAWLAYDFDAPGGGTSVAVQVIEDDPAPFGNRAVVATTAFAGDLDVLLRAESGKLWVSWVNSASDVGWSQYDASTNAWTTPAFESYASDTVADARDRIRAQVLGS